MALHGELSIKPPHLTPHVRAELSSSLEFVVRKM